MDDSTRTHCQYCDEPLVARKSTAKYCSQTCRKAAWKERALEGSIASVSRLKTGRMSVVIHFDVDVGWKRGDHIRVGEVQSDARFERGF